ncbi:MAG: galactokinase [Myxococcota bacterium]
MDRRTPPGGYSLELAAFREAFGRPPDAAVRAPGRVNLIGEHTDYNEGLVLPCAIDRDTRVYWARREDLRVEVAAHDFEQRSGFDLREARRRGDWLDYVQGVAFALAERGARVAGLDLLIASDVPRDSGLSSSAALGVAVAAAFDAAFELALGPLGCARVAHRGESGFVGVACGLLDQFASALGRRDHALAIDCRSESVEPVAMPEGRVALLVAHSGVTRSLAGGAYGDRVRECAEALAAARSAGLVPESATALRDLPETALSDLEGAAPGTAFRRARHVVTENRRVEAFRRALESGDLGAAGEILKEGQRSLRDDYDVSVPELDWLCELADALPGVYGSRLTGAGWGGCTLHLVDPGASARVAEDLAGGFLARAGRRPPIVEARPWNGVGPLSLS